MNENCTKVLSAASRNYDPPTQLPENGMQTQSEEQEEMANVWRWSRQAVEGLQYLHEKDIYHRDVIPDNMLLDKDDSLLRLCDLGSCQPADKSHETTMKIEVECRPESRRNTNVKELLTQNEEQRDENLPSTHGEIKNERTPKFEEEEKKNDQFLLEEFYSSRLVLGSFLGSGRQGMVFSAESNYRKVVVKKFHSEMACFKNGESEKLIREIAAAPHPNLVKILGIWFASPEYKTYPLGYVMEYMPGGSLSDVIHREMQQGELEYGYSEIFNWIGQAASALQLLHAMKLVHTDVKPSNMLFSSDEILKVCDFGIGHSLAPPTRDMFYMAPEMMMGETTSACDVYSLAICIWEMIHRQHAFAGMGNNFLASSQKIIQGERPEISRECDTDLQELMERAWSGNVESRPSMEEIHEFTIEKLERMELISM